MKSRLRISFSIVVGLLVVSLTFPSCYERVEGCLDSNASNYNVYADDDCCCTYPQLRVNINKQVDGANYVSTDTFTNTLGQRYQVTSQSFYISNMVLTYADGSESTIEDTLLRDIPAGSDNRVIIEDNFGLVRESSIAYTVGSLKDNGDVASIAFQVGLSDEIDMLVPSQLPSSHPLGSNNALDHFVENEGYVFIRWNIKVIQPSGIDDIIMNISGSPIPLDTALPTPLTVSPGTTTQLSLVVDYGKWLGGVDLTADKSVIEGQIISNTAAALSIQ